MGHLAGPTTETGWLAKQFIRSPVLAIRFYMDAGTFEADQFGTGGMILETSRHMRDVLLAKGYRVTYQQFVGGHDYLSWRGTFADGLIALNARKPAQRERDGGVAAIAPLLIAKPNGYPSDAQCRKSPRRVRIYS